MNDPTDPTDTKRRAALSSLATYASSLISDTATPAAWQDAARVLVLGAQLAQVGAKSVSAFDGVNPNIGFGEAAVMGNGPHFQFLPNQVPREFWPPGFGP
jgi:hypothetical protein